MSPLSTIRKRRDFLAARQAPATGTPGFLLVAHSRGDDAAARFGFTVTRKLGNAVTRNRIRRRLREIARALATMDDARPPGAPFAAPLARPGTDYIFIARRAALTRSFPALLDDAKAALLRLTGNSD